jgi:hypothetical protein
MDKTVRENPQTLPMTPNIGDLAEATGSQACPSMRTLKVLEDALRPQLQPTEGDLNLLKIPQ